MVPKQEVQVFVSCPSDIREEKDLIEEICKRVSNALDSTGLHLRFKSGSSIIGSFGNRPQSVVNDQIGQYDIFFGIWNNRYGTPTKGINPKTGKEFQSGTEEEFTIAYDRWIKTKTPEIFLFFKLGKPTEEELEQRILVRDFKKQQLSNGWINEFSDTLQLSNLVHTILFSHLLKCWNKIRIENNESKVRQQLLGSDFLESLVVYRKKYLPSIERISRTISLVPSSSQSQASIKNTNQNLLAQLAVETRIVLLGEAGSGKTSELQNLVFHLSDPASGYYPIYLRINQFDANTAFQNFLPAYWNQIDITKLVLVLDGLDEIGIGNFGSCVKELNQFLLTFPSIRMVISCRTNFYDLPNRATNGTLNNFKVFLIDSISNHQVETFIRHRLGDSLGLRFQEEIARGVLKDFSRNLFFLRILCDLYYEEGTLNHDMSYIMNIFIRKQLVVGTEYDSAERTSAEIVKVFQKVALMMEILGRNYLKDDELNEILPDNEYGFVRSTSILQIQFGSSITWQFQHNNIQEYLAARELSCMSMSEIKSLLSFPPQHKKLNATWINTLTFLLEILERNSKMRANLLNWLLTIEPEILIRLEKDKIEKSLRVRIFKKIFKYYKANEIWISSNKFREEDFINFIDTNDALPFCLNELVRVGNTRTTKLNSVRLLSHLLIPIGKAPKVRSILIEQLKINSKDPYFAFSILHSISSLKVFENSDLKRIMKIFENKNNQYVRAGLYHYIYSANASDRVVEFLLQGVSLINNNTIEDRENVNLFDEGWNLRQCLLSLKQPESLQSLLLFMSKFNNYWYDELDILNGSLVEIRNRHLGNNKLIRSVIDYYMSDKTRSDSSFDKAIIEFIKESALEKIAVEQIWEKREVASLRSTFRMIAPIISKTEIPKLVQDFTSQSYSTESLIYFVNSVKFSNKENYDFLIEILGSVGIIIPLESSVDYGAIAKQRHLEAFDVLFDPDRFVLEVNRVFDRIGESISIDEISEARRVNYGFNNFENSGLNDSAIRLIRENCDSNKGNALRSSIQSWLAPEKLKIYLLIVAYEYIKNGRHEETNEQRSWIIRRCEELIGQIDFSVAVRTNDAGDIVYTRHSTLVAFFTKRYSIKWDNKILIAMLSFDFYYQTSYAGIDHIVGMLPKVDVDNEIARCMQKPSRIDFVYMNHVKYAAVNLNTDLAKWLINEIGNPLRKIRTKLEILRIYLDNRGDITVFKNRFRAYPTEIKWRIAEQLVHSNASEMVRSFAKNIIRSNDDIDEKVRAANCLIQIQDISGFKYLASVLRTNNELDFNSLRIDLNGIKTVRALPFLLSLLEISYERKMDEFSTSNIRSSVLNGLTNIAMQDQKRLSSVLSGLTHFIKLNRTKYRHVNFLAISVQSIENKFYENRVGKLTVHEALKIVQVLGR